MLAYNYLAHNQLDLLEKPIPVLQHDRDAIVRVTLSSICSSDLHMCFFRRFVCCSSRYPGRNTHYVNKYDKGDFRHESY